MGDYTCVKPLCTPCDKAKCASDYMTRPGSTDYCMECRNNKYRIPENGTCVSCHSQCDESDGCTGTGPQHCKKCKNFKHGDTCVSQCPSGTYELKLNGVGLCESCHESCDSN